MGIFERIKNILRAEDAFQKENIQRQKEEKSLFHLQIGNIVAIEDVDYEVIGCITFNNHGWRWTEYQLKDGHRTVWLSIEQDDELEIGLYEEIKLPNNEISKDYVFNGRVYYLEEKGIATIEKVCGNLGVVVGENVKYYEYEDAQGESFLGIEKWEGEIEASIGRSIKAYNVQIYG